jgi:hypothetical protein
LTGATGPTSRLILYDVPMSAYRSNRGTLVPMTALRGMTQSPLYLQSEKVERFVDLMQKGCEFPPIKVREEGGFYVVLEGHHRAVASEQCSFTHIPVEIIPLPSAIAR